MASRRKGCCGCLVFASLIFAVCVSCGAWLFSQSQPLPLGAYQYLRFSKAVKLPDALAQLEDKRVIKSALAAKLYASLTHRSAELGPGTYRVRPGMTFGQLFAAIKKPVRQLVRLPEGWWIARTGKRLEEQGVCTAEAYSEAAKAVLKSGEFKFAQGASTLDGYLFPDTYNLPPMTPAEDVVRMQLRTFEKKVLPIIPPNVDMKRLLTLASIVELEASKDVERSRIAGIIENRLRKGLHLEIDATVLYAIQEWKVLPQGVVRSVRSPYNTYLNLGLPPGPIGSPSVKSILASLRPERHGYLYYVARPTASHYFAETYPDHLKNINKARAEWRAASSK